MSKRIPPKIPAERSWPNMTQAKSPAVDVSADKNANKNSDITDNAAIPVASTQETKSATSSLAGQAAQPLDRLDSPSAQQVGRDTGLLINFAKAHSKPVDELISAQKAPAQSTALGDQGPVAKLDERAILQDMLQRLGASLDDQMHNLVSGFLHSLPRKENPAHSGQLGALAQVISLENKTARVLPHHLEVDPLADPIARQDLEDMLTANGAKAQLLVALGAASETERSQLDAGKMTLGDFYALAARGHFGQLADQPVRYDVLRHKLASAGLDLEFHQLLQHLDSTDSQKIIDGELSPVQAFAALARARGRQE